MLQYAVKVLLTAVVVVLATELGKRSTWAGALLIALPTTSLLAMAWLWHDTGDVLKVAALSRGIFWLVLPSLALFLAFPWAVERGWGMWRALAFGCAASVVAYGVLVVALRTFDVRL